MLTLSVVRVNCINPATIRNTAIYATVMTKEQADEVMVAYGPKFPLGRVGDVPETSAAIGFLADNNLSSYVTGSCLPIDGGLIAGGDVSTLVEVP